jgi:hypothetical protein
MQLILGFGFLGLLLVAGSWLLRPTPPVRLRADRSGGKAVLRPPPGRNAILGAMAVGPTALMVAIAFASAHRSGIPTGGLVLVGLAVLLGVATAAYFLVAEFRLRVRVDDTAVERVDPVRSRRMAWSEVTRLYYNGVNRWFVLTGPGTRMWIGENMSGIGDFAESALARVRPEVLQADPVAHDALREIAEEARREDAAHR